MTRRLTRRRRGTFDAYCHLLDVTVELAVVPGGEFLRLPAGAAEALVVSAAPAGPLPEGGDGGRGEADA